MNTIAPARSSHQTPSPEGFPLPGNFASDADRHAGDHLDAESAQPETSADLAPELPWALQYLGVDIGDTLDAEDTAIGLDILDVIHQAKALGLGGSEEPEDEFEDEEYADEAEADNYEEADSDEEESDDYDDDEEANPHAAHIAAWMEQLDALGLKTDHDRLLYIHATLRGVLDDALARQKATHPSPATADLAGADSGEADPAYPDLANADHADPNFEKANLLSPTPLLANLPSPPKKQRERKKPRGLTSPRGARNHPPPPPYRGGWKLMVMTCCCVRGTAVPVVESYAERVR